MLHLIARLNDGGPARVIANLAATLPDVRMTVVTGTCGEGEADVAEVVAAAGARVLRMPELGRSLRGLADLQVYRRFVEIIARERPDVVHTHTAKAGVLGRLAARWQQVPCLHTYHGHVLHGYFSPPVSHGIRCIEQAVAGACHHQALTRSQAAELAGIGLPGHWHVLPVPVAPVVLEGAPQAQVGWLGRLVDIKDPGLWDAVLARLPGVTGVVAGAGPRASVLARHRCLGTVPAGRLLGQVRVLLMTSRNEGQPLAAVEAALAGVPVVAPPVGGLADLIEAGVVCGAERTPEALAAAVKRLLEDGPLRQQRIDQARLAAEAFLPDRLAPRYRELYRRVAG